MTSKDEDGWGGGKSKVYETSKEAAEFLNNNFKEENVNIDDLNLSGSVKNVIRNLPDKVSASFFVDGLLRLHPEVAKSQEKQFQVNIENSEHDVRSVYEWLFEVRSLFDQKQALHTRLVILGLSILDQNLTRQLFNNNFLDDLVAEIKEPVESLFTIKGFDLWNNVQILRNIKSENVPIHSDNPSNVDQLGRKALSKMLALRLRRIWYDNPLFNWEKVPGNDSNRLIEFLIQYLDVNWLSVDKINKSDDGKTISISDEKNSISLKLNNKKSRAYLKVNNQNTTEFIVKKEKDELKVYESRMSRDLLVNIHGPWGSGKSTFLKFLDQNLSEKLPDDLIGIENSPWIVVNFNAWLHQRQGHPWWSLMDSIFQNAIHQMKDRKNAYYLWFQEQIWRGVIGGLRYYLLAFLLLSLATYIFYWAKISTSELLSWISLFFGVVSAVFGLSQSLLSGSNRSTNAFMEYSRDPMEKLKKHLNTMIKHIDQPIVIFIDDLDRCKVSYTVDLLEGIQTLFRGLGLTFVVAADQRWLCASYTNAYKDFTSTVNEPGRPLGYLFMEKTFQITMSLPRLPPKLQDQYWKYLIQIKSENQEETENFRKQATEKIQDLKTEEDIMVEIQKHKENPYEEQALREAAIIQLASPEIEMHIEEHILSDFAHLVEANPRGMKRLVNAYSIQRAMDIYRGGNIEPKKLVLWTIILLRWPFLAEYLEEHPDMIKYIGEDSIPEDDIPQNLWELFYDKSQIVRDVIQGKNVETNLDENTIKYFACLIEETNQLKFNMTTENQS